MPNLIDQIVSRAQAPARERSERYAARLDNHLGTLPETERRGFCDRELAKWVERYEQWALAVDTSTLEVKPGDATAWDYTLTIAEIGKRQAMYPASVSA